MKTKIAVAAALSALVLPVAADAAKPAQPGKKGRDNAAQRKSQQTPKTKKVGFTLKGLIVANETFPAFAPVVGTEHFTLTSDPFELDLISANRAARKKLGIDKTAIEGTVVTEIDELATDDHFRFRTVGITDAGTDGTHNDLAAGDSVKIIGKVERTRNAKVAGEPTSFTFGDVDVRKVVVIREAPQV